MATMGSFGGARRGPKNDIIAPQNAEKKQARAPEFQARPGPVHRVLLFAWRLRIELQYLLDLIFDRPDFRPLPVRLFAPRTEAPR
jgi:hypothetical protein